MIAACRAMRESLKGWSVSISTEVTGAPISLRVDASLSSVSRSAVRDLRVSGVHTKGAPN
jgi:hypothetical protein